MEHRKIKFLLVIYIIVLICAFGMTPLHAQIIVETITDEFDGSGGLNMSSDGKLYVANFGESLDNGTGTEVWQIDYRNEGQPELFANGLNGASGNDFDSEGNLFQSSIAAGTVSKISAEGNVSFFVASGISCNVGINIDSEDNLYVCNCCGSNGNTIRKVTKEGISSVFSSSSLLFCPNGITRDKDDNLYVSNFSNGNVVKISPSGQASLLAIVPGIPGVSAPSNGHIIYSEKEDILYVASHGSHRIYKLTLDGELTVLAGTGQRGNNDGSAEMATFSRPNGLALSTTEDTLFVNSSIPVTNANGRPLNPSVIRMITGLRGATSTKNFPKFNYSVSYFPSTQSIKLSDLPIVDEDLAFRLLTRDGKQIFQSLIPSNTKSFEMNIPSEVISGLYFVTINTSSGKAKSSSLLIH